MLNKLNQTVSDLLLKPKFRFCRHLMVQITLALITVSNLFPDSNTVAYERLWIFLFAYVMLGAIVYANAYLLIPRMLLVGKTERYIVCLSAIILFMVWCDVYFCFDKTISFDSEFVFTAVYFLSNTCFLMAGITGVLLFKSGVDNKRRIEEMQRATMEVELANLKSQINPHFLFNMLNNANVLATEDRDKSSYLLSKLNSLLKYQISESSKSRVSLKSDINFLNEYLELEKSRRGGFEYTIEQYGDCNIRIPPLLFIPFVENAVKHNPESDSYVNLSFRIENGRLHFECENPKSKVKQMKRVGGIGLLNVKRRLDLLFGTNCSLELCDGKEKYAVVMEFDI